MWGWVKSTENAWFNRNFGKSRFVRSLVYMYIVHIAVLKTIAIYFDVWMLRDCKKYVLLLSALICLRIYS